MHDEQPRDSVRPHPTPLQRWIVLSVIALGVLIPLRYYLGDDPYDERFSWRMFSSVRVQACQSQLTVTSEGNEHQAVKLQSELHRAWLSAIERNRTSVIEKVLERQCTAPHVRQVTLTNRCRDTRRSPMPPMTWQLTCATGAVSHPEFSE